MHYLYILHSITVNKYYIGETFNVNERLLKHNKHSYENSFTKVANDWKIVLSFKCDSKNQAVCIERFIKRMKSKVFIQKLIDDPAIINDIITKYEY